MKEITLLDHRDFLAYIIKSIKGANESIDISLYKFSLPSNEKQGIYHQLRVVLESAVEKGNRCRVMLSRVEPDQGVSAVNWATAQWLKSVGIECRYLYSRSCLHTKMMIIDNKTLVVGSHNWVERTYNGTVDISVVISDYPIVARAANFFEDLWLKSNRW